MVENSKKFVSCKTVLSKEDCINLKKITKADTIQRAIQIAVEFRIAFQDPV